MALCFARSANDKKDLRRIADIIGHLDEITEKKFDFAHKAVIMDTKEIALDGLPKTMKDLVDGNAEMNKEQTDKLHYYLRFQCAVCKIHGATKKCGRCKKIRYCSKECQKKHWTEHKKTCKEV